MRECVHCVWGIETNWKRKGGLVIPHALPFGSLSRSDQYLFYPNVRYVDSNQLMVLDLTSGKASPFFQFGMSHNGMPSSVKHILASKFDVFMVFDTLRLFEEAQEDREPFFPSRPSLPVSSFELSLDSSPRGFFGFQLAGEKEESQGARSFCPEQERIISSFSETLEAFPTEEQLILLQERLGEEVKGAPPPILDQLRMHFLAHQGGTSGRGVGEKGGGDPGKKVGGSSQLALSSHYRLVGPDGLKEGDGKDGLFLAGGKFLAVLQCSGCTLELISVSTETSLPSAGVSSPRKLGSSPLNRSSTTLHLDQPMDNLFSAPSPYGVLYYSKNKGIIFPSTLYDPASSSTPSMPSEIANFEANAPSLLAPHPSDRVFLDIDGVVLDVQWHDFPSLAFFDHDSKVGHRERGKGKERILDGGGYSTWKSVGAVLSTTHVRLMTSNLVIFCHDFL